MREDGWGELGWCQWGREQLRANRAPAASTCEQRTATTTTIPTLPPPSAAPSPHARRGSARLTHKAGCSALEDLSTPKVHRQSIYRGKKMKMFTSSNNSLYISCPLLQKNKKQEASTVLDTPEGWQGRGGFGAAAAPRV